MKKFFSLVQEDRKVELMIYGDITSWEWYESDVSSYTLSKQLEKLDVDEINVYINSYGGEVAEGLAIYNTLIRNKAKVTTYCDGFACSAASVIFMAGSERIMGHASLLMIHNAWSYTSGDANSLRKEAADLEKITKASILSYLKHVNVEEAQLIEMLNNETWILPDEALAMGFATRIAGLENSELPSQNAKNSLIGIIRSQAKSSQKAELSASEIADAVAEKLMQKAELESTINSQKLPQFLKGLAR